MTSDSDGPLFDPRLQAQARLDPIMDELEEFIDSQALRVRFAQIVSHALNYRFTLYWKGVIPPELQQKINQLRDITGVQIDVLSSPYSEAEMFAEVQRISSLPQSETGGVPLTEVGPRRDFAGIVVGVSDTSKIESVRNGGIDSTFPLTVEAGPDAALAVGGRWNDAPPFQGGAAIFPDPGSIGFCSSGFGIRRNSSGAGGILTARHCGASTEYYSYGGYLMGRAGTGDASLDVVVIDGVQYQGVDTYGASIYTRDWRSSTRLPISGGENPRLNEWVFASGAGSGACVAQVTSINTTADGINVGPGFWMRNRDGVACVGQGDSGGPVVHATTGGNGRARGIIIAIDRDFQGPCVGYQAPGRLCSTRSFHTNIGAIRYQIGVSLQTHDAQ